MTTAAVVGCGGIGSNHMRALSRMDEVGLRCVVDLSKELAEQRGAEFEVSALDDPAELPEVDFVVVATPPATHFGVVEDLLKRGFNVFCEKPLTLTVASSEYLRDLAAAQGRHLGVGFKMRYEPWYTKAREVIESIGPLVGVSLTKQQERHDKPWLPETGAMQELSSHDFDLIHWIAGTRPKRMICAELRSRFGWPAEDAFTLVVEYENGMLGSLSGLYCESLRFTGRDQTLRFQGEQGYLSIDRGERLVLHRREVAEIKPEGHRRWRMGGFFPELQDFAAAVRGEEAHYPDAEAAVWSTWVVEQANQVAGRPVPVQPGFSPGAAR